MKRHGEFQLSLTFFLGVMAIMMVGCVPRNRAEYAPTEGATAFSGDRTMVVEPGPKRYYRDENGRLYHVDPQGGLRVIERNVRVEPGTGGLFAIIDDQNVRYYYDETGRLYYRDSGGKVLYVEESNAGKVIDPLPLLRGEYAGRNMHLRSPEFCRSELNKCMNAPKV